MAKAEGTREKLLDSAARLFAERGIDGVSLREIGQAAGQLNTGAARYHFGSKIGLVDAVFEHRMVAINERRVRMLDQITADGASADLRRLVEAFLVPLSTALGDPGRETWYLRFAVQAGHLDGSAPTRTADQPWTSGMDRLGSLVPDALDDVPVPLRAQRWWMTQSHVGHALADRERQLRHAARHALLPRDVFLSAVTDTAVALISAPLSAATRELWEGAHP